MNVIWTSIFTLALCSTLIFSPSIVVPSLIEGATNAVNLSIKLIAIYGVWCGLLAILEDTNLNTKLNILISPIVSLLFGKNISHDTRQYISTNIISNFLGMGNASIPSGIKAVSSMYKGANAATDNMLMFLLINVFPLQLLPTTVIGLISASNGTTISSVIIGVIFTNIVALIVGGVVLKICSKIFK
jgi:spore maturation protein A